MHQRDKASCHFPSTYSRYGPVVFSVKAWPPVLATTDEVSAVPMAADSWPSLVRGESALGVFEIKVSQLDGNLVIVRMALCP